jgi:nucleoside-diphosphate-sugar epimerase
MKVLVIGNSGFIGSFLTDSLAKAGHQVVGMDIQEPNTKENLSEFILGDILEPEEIMRAAKGADAIIHLAAKHHDFGVSRDEFFKVNVQGVRNVLESLTQSGIKKIIFYSTVAVYDDVKSYTTEDTFTNPFTAYGESKLAAEKLLSNWVGQDQSRQAIVIRPTVVFGPTNYANMYNLIDKIYKKQFVFVGRGINVKSVAYVENLVAATIFLLERMRPGIEVFNYSDYPQMTTEQIVKTIAQHLSCSVPRFKIPLRPAMALTTVFDIIGTVSGYNFPITANRIKKFNTATQYNSDKIRNIGFKPPINLSEGFKRMAGWYLENRNNRTFVRQEMAEE